MHDKMILFPRGSWETRLPFQPRSGQNYYGALHTARFIGLPLNSVIPALFELEHDVWELRVCYVQGPKQFVAYAARHGHDAFYEVVEALCTLD